MTTPTGSLTPDTLVHGRYRVVRQIGRGGMGAVYEAEDTRLGNRVALKQTLVRGAALDAAFEREARVLAALRHPALPVVSDYFAEGDGQFLVMQYIPGEDLASLLQQRGAPLSWAEVRPWAVQLLDALDYLHNQSPPIIHRDIKPQNLKLTPRGEIVLLDFGLAKRSAGEAATSAASVYGYTPYYAPLEQIQGSGTDPRSDLYSLAATLYALLTNSAPASALDRAAAVFQGEPDPLRPAGELAPALPPEVAALLAQSMALQIGERPPSAAAVRDGLAQQVRLAPSSAGQATVALGRPAGQPAPSQPPAPPQPLSLPKQDGPARPPSMPQLPTAPALPPRGRSWAAPAILLAMVLLCGVLVFAATRVVGALADIITIPGPDDAQATAAALLTALPTFPAIPELPTADPREQGPATDAGGPIPPDVLVTVAALQTEAAANGVELPNVAATVAAVQTEVAESVGGVVGGVELPDVQATVAAALGGVGAAAAPEAGPAPLLSFGEQGSGQGFLDDPRGVAVGPDGAIYVADYSSGRVQRFGADGGFERGWLVEDGGPILALAADREGSVFVSQNSRISVYDGASGELRGTLADANGYGFADLVITAAGELLGIPWAGEDVVRLSPDGQELGRVSAPLARADVDGQPQSLATDGLGTLYLLGEEGTAVFIFSPDGAFRDRFAVEGWAFSDIAVDGQGRVYVSGFGGGVQVFDGAGQPLGALATDGGIGDMTFGADNNLYVTTNRPRVLKLAVELPS